MTHRPPRRRLEILPAGGVPLPILHSIAAAVDAALGTVHHIREAMEVPDDWRADAGVRADAVLDALLARAAEGVEIEGGAITLAVIADPLVSLDGQIVYGLAAIGGAQAVMGLGALDGASDCDETTLAERAAKAAVHEVAHAMGLEHCADPTCVMYPARDIADVDRKAIGFCKRCSEDLAHATLDGVRI